MNGYACPPEHKHADSGTCYVIHKCRCADCTAEQAARGRRRNKLHAYGRFDSGLVDIAPVREYVEHLQAFGYGWKRIAKLAGVGNTTVSQIIYGRKGSNSDPRKGETLKRIKRETAEKILAVKPSFEGLAGGALIPARGTHRRVQALVARGWSQSKICALVGIDRGNFWTMMQGDVVTVATHRAVAGVFDRLWNEPPPRATHRDRIAYSRSIRHAAERRWLPPLAWDDIDTDREPPVVDGVGGIDDVVVQLAVSGDQVRLSPAERREAVVRLHATGLSDGAIADRLHLTGRTVLRIRQELALPAAVAAAGERIVGAA